MSYPEAFSSDKADFFYSSGDPCGNCGRQGVALHYNEDGDWHLCDECAVEQERVEQRGRELAAVSSACEERAGIIDDARSLRELAHRLRVHELTECAACASTRKTVQSDREHVNAAAVCCEGEAA